MKYRGAVQKSCFPPCAGSPSPRSTAPHNLQPTFCSMAELPFPSARSSTGSWPLFLAGRDSTSQNRVQACTAAGRQV